LESASLTRSPAGTSLHAWQRLKAVPWPQVALGVLIAAAVVGFFVFPIYPNYDSYYSLLWGRELLHLQTPSFDAYRAATEHPLAIAFGALMALFGRGGDRLMVACTLASFVVLAMGVYRLAARTFTPLVGLIAAGLLCTRFDFPFLAARAYIDIPYLAMIVWAATLEFEKPRRGGIVWLLLFAASLMRPEAWLLTGLYWLWMFPPATWRQRIKTACYTAAGPLVWVALDTAVTGHPLFSLQHTNGLAEELGRAKGLSQVPHATWAFLISLDKAPVVLGGIIGAILAVIITPKRTVMVFVLLVTGIATFFAVGVAGLSIINRYLLIPSLMLMILASVAIGGWTMLVPGTRWRWAWALGALALVIYGITFTALRVDLSKFTSGLYYRGDSHKALVALLDRPDVRAAINRHCGPVTVPNHKHIPDTRWILGASQNGVIARSALVEEAPGGPLTIRRDVQRELQSGVAVFESNRTAELQDQLIVDSQPVQLTAAQLVPERGFHRIAVNAYFAAYVRCR
jgi:hypothetical protein